MKTIKAARATRVIMTLTVGVLTALLTLPGPVVGQGVGTQVTVPSPAGVDFFNLSLQQTRNLSRSKNFEVVGHSYFKGPWLTPFAQQTGIGAGFNAPRVYDGTAYLAGYASPPTLFGVLIADVHDPANMQPLTFISCNPGTRCPYVRVNPRRHILVASNDRNRDNPNQPPAGQPARAGLTFYDISNAAAPRPLGSYLTRENGATHGFEIDDRYVYACANTPQSKPDPFGNQGIVIVDYQDQGHPTLVSSLHIQGQHEGEAFAPQDQHNPDGTPQHLWCHEIVLHQGRLYVAWRDAGLVIVDVGTPSAPRVISRFDYVPPFNGGSLGAAHTAAPVIVNAEKQPTLVVLTDEIFDCPPGFSRIIDISDLANPQVVSTYRVPYVDDNFNARTGKFVCPSGPQSIHLPWFDFRSASLLHQAWYAQGVRTWDISNPFLPREVGYYLSPPYPCFGTNCGGGRGRAERQTREVFQDRDTGLIYVTDGSGGGLTVLRWTGPIPQTPPIPGAR